MIDPFNSMDYDNHIAHTNPLTALSQSLFVGRVPTEGVGDAVTITTPEPATWLLLAIRLLILVMIKKL